MKTGLKKREKRRKQEKNGGVILLKTFQELCDEESLCTYCSRTDYGENKSYVTPTGFYSCEGSYCEEAYEAYLEENETNADIVNYASKVKLIEE